MLRWARDIPVGVLAPLLLVVPTVLVAGLLILIAGGQGAAWSRDFARTETSAIKARVAERLDGLFEEPVRLVRLNGLLASRGELSWERPRSMVPVFADQMRAFDALSSVSWGSPSGSVWVARYTGIDGLVCGVADGETGGELRLYRLDEADPFGGEPVSVDASYDVEGRVWYTLPMERGSGWTPPYVWAGGNGWATLGIGYGERFVPDGEGDTRASGRGVFNAEFSLSGLSGFLRTLTLPEGGVVFVVDGEGTLVASSSGAPVAGEGGTVLAAESSDAVVRGVARALGRRESGVLEVGGERYVADASAFVGDGGLAWTIAAAVPESALLAEVNAARTRNAVIAGVVVLLTLLFGVRLGRSLIKPVHRLREHAHRVGEDDFDSRVELEITPELRGLAASMNEMAEHLRDRAQMRRSLALASEVQRALLPDREPDPPGLELSGESRYCDETGGDYYDFLDIVGTSGESTVLVVGDVVGHGIAAAMLMATARGMLRSHAKSSGSLAGLLTHVNALLSVDTGGSKFMTMLLVEIDAGRRRVRWASAGHGPPIVYDPSGGGFLELEGGDLPLGIVGDASYEEHEVAGLGEGAVVILATDGVWEAKAPSGEQFGMEAVRGVIERTHGGGAQAVGAALTSAVRRHIGGVPHDDDVTLVVARLVDVEAGVGGSARERGDG